MRRAPRWTIAFLRALERTGEVQASAEDAGIDKSTAYARRKAHADFGEAWAGAVRRYRTEHKRSEGEEIAGVRLGSRQALKEAPSTTFGGPPSPDKLGEDLAVSGGQVKRVNKERWGERKEAIFFEELAATNNISRAAKAAGVSYNAVHARRLKHPLFAAKWEAVAASSRATIDMHLIEEARKSFDPASMGLGEVQPRVTIDQAIKISQIGAAKARAERDPFEEQAANMTEDEVEELRKRVLQKVERLADRRKAEKLAEGWSYDPEHDLMLPPGWVRDSPEGDA